MSGGCSGGHGHGSGGHGHGSGGCDGGHDHSSPELGVMYSLYTRIDTMNVECLNEATADSGKKVFKAWEDRLTFDEVS